MCKFNFDTTYTQLPSQFYTIQNAIPVLSPEVVIVNHDLANSMALDFSELDKGQQANLFSGNRLPKGIKTFSQAYAGHQFGHFTMLGDGRAVIWGEHVTPDKKRCDIQFKGSGQTPYSRRGDGRAALGPMLREYLISEAMFELGVPTTRSLAVVKTGEEVFRETKLKGAVLTRVASSHIRVGTFEFAAALQDKELIHQIMNYTIKRHFPELINKSSNLAISLIEKIIDSQTNLIVEWMRVGFIHGVMNTDNMALSGETIDYGPCAFMDHYNSNTVFSSIDRGGRYAFGNQPKIAQWNIARFIEALIPLINEDVNKSIKIGEELINSFPELYEKKWLEMMRSKLGLFREFREDKNLINDLLTWMQKNNADYTNTFIDLGKGEQPQNGIYKNKDFEDWFNRWKIRLSKNEKSLEGSLELMNSKNPQIIPRNHKVEETLKAADNDNFNPFNKLLEVLKFPYKNDSKNSLYKEPPTPDERVKETFCGT